MGPPYGTEVGLEWHALMENCVKEVLTKTSYELYEKGDAGIYLLRKLHDEMKISIISGKFPLYGYMYNNKELPPYLPSPRTNDIDRLCLFVCLFFLLFLYIFWIMPFYVLVCHFLRNYHICVSSHLSTS